MLCELPVSVLFLFPSRPSLAVWASLHWPKNHSFIHSANEYLHFQGVILYAVRLFLTDMVYTYDNWLREWNLTLEEDGIYLTLEEMAVDSTLHLLKIGLSRS